ncbi:uncharacterized protein LOC111526523 isoform X3 [Piliocolobus tephrosceles]|uniref:uncharacterized protein LOC111526523 isoform X3 n=1 Tax=Piliocolobus tephrosceles TaxID=591936 RepID=UPI000C2AE78E|nr:uncharacterized protein LOC111526523 isoform X3 [Piliocolobus tephrosceles]
MVRHACFPFTFCRACKSPETSKPCFLNSLQHWVLEPVPHKHQRMTLYSRFQGMVTFMCLANSSLKQHNVSCADDQKYLDKAKSPGNSTCTMLHGILGRSSKDFQAK